MPLYEYECGACGHRFERIQKFSDPPPSACPGCGGAVRKLMSSPAIQFKGSGWYVTDYARKGRGAEGSTEAKPDSPQARSKSGPASESSTSSSSGPAATPGPSSSDS